MEKVKKTYTGCVMIQLSLDNWEDLREIFDKEDFFDKGFESDPHITLMYGLRSMTSTREIKDILEGSKLVGQKIELSKLGKFSNDERDVLYYKVTNPKIFSILKRLNKHLVEDIDTKTDFPKYSPHCTVAYLKSGTIKKYMSKLPNLKGSIKNYHYSTTFE